MLTQLIPHVAIWQELGQSIGLTPGKLEEIKENDNSVRRRMENVILEWMYGNGNRPISWFTLLEALRHPLVGRSKAASKIQQEIESTSLIN